MIVNITVYAEPSITRTQASRKMPLYFKEFDPRDELFALRAPPTFAYLDGWGVLDKEQNCVLLAKNMSAAGQACYNVTKAEGRREIDLGSDRCVGIAVANKKGKVKTSSIMQIRWFEVVPPLGV
jgi:hypothetical protein